MKRSGFSHRIWFDITVLAIFFGGFAFYQIGRSAWEREAQPFLSISSPDKTYSITFSGQRDRPTFPFKDHSVYMEIRKAGEFVRRSTKFLRATGLIHRLICCFPTISG